MSMISKHKLHDMSIFGAPDGGFDITSLVFLQGLGSFSSGALNTYQTLISITGKGYISHATVRGLNVGSYVGIRITMDGDVVYEGYQNSNGEVGMGIWNSSLAYTQQNHTNLAGIVNSDYSITNFPTRGALQDADRAVVISAPLYFSSSLLIEVKRNNTNAITYFYEGGYA